MLFPEHRRDDPRLLGIARQMAADTGADIFLRQQRALMARIDSRPSLAFITVPTLLLRGSEDGITTQAQQDEMLVALSDARLETISGVGHLPTVEAPEIVAPLIEHFIDA